ncbi:MAG: serine/threonine protein kinase [Myxococcales bacterium]|nr:serine/threonine protein kinase [Myxococcales bacterium]MDD9969579.1 serine/threonine protein kinase [Myxococcales bacterium]
MAHRTEKKVQGAGHAAEVQRTHLRVVRLREEEPKGFAQALALAATERARARMASEWDAQGLSDTFEALEGFLRDPAPSYEQLAESLGESREEARMMVHRVRAEWLELFEEEIAGLVDQRPLLLDDAREAADGTDDGQRDHDRQPFVDGGVNEDAYQILETLGAGRHGTVYRAARSGSGQTVALKIFDGRDRELKRFYTEFEALKCLHHPHIVKVHDSGVYGGRPCFSMELVAGGTLADADNRARFADPARAARLLIKLAHAVQFAHEQGILHRDLKPSNVLIGKDGEPRLSDFSLNRSLHSESISESGTVVGTFGYMAPEQAGAREEPVRAASDVYGLGALLYTLLAREAPTPERLSDLLKHFDQGRPPLPLAEHQRGLRGPLIGDLETVCMTALEHDPAARYQTAGDFAEDLTRALAGRPLRARPPGPLGRLRRLWLRHPLSGWIVIMALSAGLLLGGTMWSQRAKLLATTLAQNATLAEMQARHVHSVLEGYAKALSEAALDPEVQHLLSLGGVTDAPDTLARHLGDFDSMFVLNPQGRVRARYPSADPSYYERPFAFRDYFRGGLALKGPAPASADPARVYVARAFRSHFGSMKVALATPVHAPDGRRTGLLVATKSVSSTLRRVPSELLGGQYTALLAPHDVGQPEQPAHAPASADGLTVVVHSQVEQIDDYRIDSGLAARVWHRFGRAGLPGQQLTPRAPIALEVEDYRDPVPGFEGRWIAGLAPVAHTGYVVVVGTPYEGISAWVKTLLLIANLALALAAAAAWFAARRRRRGA